MGRDRARSGRLHRLLLVRAGTTRAPDADASAGPSLSLSADGRREVEATTHFWEWADAVVSSPARGAQETAAILAGGHPVMLDPELRPAEDAASSRAHDPPDAVAARADRFLDWAFASPYRSLLVVSHAPLIRAITATLVGPLPPGRPLPAEMVLLTRPEGGLWHLGRRSSDPEALQSPLERNGLSGPPLERPPERHVGHLEIAVA